MRIATLVSAAALAVSIALPTGTAAQFEYAQTEALDERGRRARWRYPVSPYLPGSYAGRSFYCCASGPLGAHLGEDVERREGSRVRSIGAGTIKYYEEATGYGELAVVIEHDLGSEYTFVNGHDEFVTTRYILSIYGHIRSSKKRDGKKLKLEEGSVVRAGQVIGFINDDAHNGDGAEHVHVAIRLHDAATAQSIDPDGWFRGYERDLGIGIYYAAASHVLEVLGARDAAYEP